MQGTKSIAATVFMVLILIFAIIHLGVSISIIVKVRDYGDVLGPERGLAGFNIVISIYALIVGGFGLFAVLTDRGILSMIVAFACIVLALFTIASLITALSINSLSINFVSNRFQSRMNDYINNQDSRNIVDNIQINYECCGNNIWLDWASASLNATAPSTNATATTPLASNGTTTTLTNSTTTIATNGSTTVIATNTTTTQSVPITNTTTTAIATTVTGSTAETNPTATTTSSETVSNATGSATVLKILKKKRRSVKGKLFSLNDTPDDSRLKTGPPQKFARRRRQTQSSYGGIPGLPTSFSVTLPQSCCSNDISAVQNLSNLYCISNANTGSSTFNTDGCSKKLAKFSIGQSLGLAVINSFLFVLALAAIPVLIRASDLGDTSQNNFTNQPMSQHQQQYAHGHHDPANQYSADQYSAGHYPADQYLANQYPTNQYPTNNYPSGYYPEMSYNNFNSAPPQYIY